VSPDAVWDPLELPDVLKVGDGQAQESPVSKKFENQWCFPVQGFK
jgi:hypothetical protein